MELRSRTIQQSVQHHFIQYVYSHRAVIVSDKINNMPSFPHKYKKKTEKQNAHLGIEIATGVYMFGSTIAIYM